MFTLADYSFANIGNIVSYEGFSLTILEVDARVGVFDDFFEKYFLNTASSSR